MRSEEITIPSSRGTDLFGVIDVPQGEPVARRISRALTDEGIAVLRFDFAGLGKSEGDFADSTYSGNREDIKDAARWLAQQYAPVNLLIGHSLGGAAVLSVAHEVDSLNGVVTIGAPFDPEHVTHLFAGALDDIEEAGEARVQIGGRQITIGHELVEDISTFDQEAKVEALRTPLLLLHSPDDEIVDVHNAQAIYRRAHQPKSFIALDGANHLLTTPGSGSYVAGVIAAWAARYLDSPEDSQAPHEKVPAGTVVASPDGQSDFGTRVHTGDHSWIADEPTSVKGGQNRGPNPFDLLQAALAVCTSMTMNMYARRKGYDIGNTQVSVTLNSASEDGERVAVVERIVNFDTALGEEQRRALLRIAEKCPVHRALEGRFDISTRPS